MGKPEDQRARIRNRAQSYFENVNPAHDWFHVERVYRLAESLADEEGAASETVRLASLLHDIGRKAEDDGEIANHAEWGATEAATILTEEGYEDEQITAVTHCIRAHRYSTEPAPQTIEAKVISDADNLDALGAVGIARTFVYSAQYERPIVDPSLPPEADDSSAGQSAVNHLHKKILQLHERMYTDAGRRRATQRHEFVESYLSQFEREMHGER